MIVLGIILGIFFLIAILPLGVRVRYAPEEDLLLRVNAGPVKVTLLPKKADGEKKEKEKKPKKEKKLKDKATEDAAPEKKAKLDIPALLRVAIPAAGKALDRFRRKLTIKELTLWFSSGGTDPYKVVMTYGNVNAILGGALPWLENHFNIKKRDIRTGFSFEDEGTKILADLWLSIRVWQIIYLALALLPVVKAFLKMRKAGPEDGHKIGNNKNNINNIDDTRKVEENGQASC